MQVLVVEDEIRLAEALTQILEQAKYTVETVHDGRSGLDYALAVDYDVIVLDVMLPGMDGFEVVRALRDQKRPIPVLMLTARDEIRDKVHGLDAGADDYMTKPFSPEELLARVRALTRRQGEVTMETLSFGDLTLNLSTASLHRGEKSVRIGHKEMEVLRLLMLNPTMVMPKETILTRVWGSDTLVEENNVEAYMSFLRKKFAYLGSRVTIGAVRRVGYQLEEKSA